MTDVTTRTRDETEDAPTVQAPIGIRSLSLSVLAVVAAIFTLHQGQDFFIPLVLSVLISYAIDPIVTWCAARGVPRALAAALVLATLVGAIGAGAYSLRDEASAIIRDLPRAAERLSQSVRGQRGRSSQDASTIETVQRAATQIEKAATQASEPSPAPRGVMRVQVEEPPLRVREYLWWGSAGVLAAAAQLVAVLFLVYFLLVSGDLFKRKLVRIAGPTITKKKITVQILDEINVQIERFLLVQLFTSVIVGVVSWIAFRLLGLEQAAIWAIAAGLFNSIPYFGPVVVTAGVSVVALTQFGTISMAAAVGAVALAITSLEGFLLTPWLTSRAASMNAVAIFVGLLFWTWVWGVWGTLLAVPMLMVMKAVCDRIEDLQSFGEMLGD